MKTQKQKKSIKTLSAFKLSKSKMLKLSGKGGGLSAFIVPAKLPEGE